MHKGNSLVVDILVIIGGLLILLLGMWVVNLFVTSEVASFIDIVPMCLGLWLIVNKLHVPKLLSREYVVNFFVILILLTTIILIYSLCFVFSKDGYFYTLGNTGILNEHSWAYDNILAISERPFNDLFNGKLQDLNLGKYTVSFAYTSLMFRFGGNVLTHICIWRAFHLALVVILMVLSANKMGTTNKKTLFMIAIVCLLMPMMDTIFAYNHDGVGYAFISLGTYIFVSCYKYKMRSLIAFPFYVMLFYWFRRPYALVAIAMYLWGVFSNKRKTSDAFVGIIATIILLLYFLATVNIPSLLVDEMQVVDYSDYSGRQGRSFINMFLITLIGYFPWTNLLRDVNWPYAIFSCFQGALNIVIMYFFIKCYRKNFSTAFSNPLIIAGVIFFIAALALPGHLSYTSVAMLFFLASTNNSKYNYLKSYGFTVLGIFVLGFIYSIFR